MKNLKLFFLVITSATIMCAHKHTEPILYKLYDSTINGVKGGVFGAVAGPSSLGIYTVYADVKFFSVLIDRFALATSSATHFGNKTRKQLEQETALREITNRGAKAVMSTATTVAVPLLLYCVCKGININALASQFKPRQNSSW